MSAGRSSSRRGFTLIEVMITSVILGVGVMGLVGLYTSSARGVGGSRVHTTATQVALQRLEQIAGSADALPACDGPIGCRASRSELAPPLGGSRTGGFDCTQYTNGMGESAVAAAGTGRYRIDTVVEPHPSTSQDDEGRFVSVSVCWVGDGNVVEQVLAQRFVLPRSR